MAKIKLQSYHDLSKIQSVENKIIMADSQLFIISSVQVTEEEETYGRKNNKIRKVQYLNLNMHGYNPDGEFIGVFDEQFITHLLLMYDVLKMLKKYRNFKKAQNAMEAKVTALNNPLQTLTEITMSPDVKEEIDRLIKEDRPLLAMKLYKVETGCTLEEAKEYIKSLTF